jgi:putative DNA primase/helicase
MSTEQNIRAEGNDAGQTEIVNRETALSHRRTRIVLAECEPWPEPVDGQQLLEELSRTFATFAVLPKWAPETLALWTLHTYAFQLRDVSAYLGIESPVKRCGKTTLLGVLNKLAHRPVLAANISFKAFFHVIEQARPTLLIDETDTFLPRNDELRGIMNAGCHRESAFVIRFAQPAETSGAKRGRPPKLERVAKFVSAMSAEERAEGHDSGLARFSCWCPKAMAAIGRLPDTLGDRCIVIRMQRKTPEEKCERLRRLGSETLTRQCARFVRDREQAIAEAAPGIPLELNDRAADIWEPLLALADLAGGQWPERARQAAVALSGAARQYESESSVGVLLYELRLSFLQLKTRRVLSRDLVELLNIRATLPNSLRQYLNGKEITELWLAGALRPYGIRPKCFRAGGNVGKGYFAEDFAEIFERYLVLPEMDETRAEIGAPSVQEAAVASAEVAPPAPATESA